MARGKKKKQTPPKQCNLGWTFTEDEERRMRKAQTEALAFMRTYGKGRRPYMIDLSRYTHGEWKEVVQQGRSFSAS